MTKKGRIAGNEIKGGQTNLTWLRSQEIFDKEIPLRASLFVYTIQMERRCGVNIDPPKPLTWSPRITALQQVNRGIEQGSMTEGGVQYMRSLSKICSRKQPLGDVVRCVICPGNL